MATVGQQGKLKENLTELHIIVRTTGLSTFFQIVAHTGECAASKIPLVHQENLFLF